MDATLLLKATLLLLLTLLSARLLCRAAVTRHRLWTSGFAALLALPLLTSALPALYVPVPESWGASEVFRASQNMAGESANTGDPLPADRPDERSTIAGTTIADGRLTSRAPASPDRTSRKGRLAARTLLLVAWLIGTTAAVAALLLSLFRARRLAFGAEEVADPAWQRAADVLGRRLGLRRPARLLISHSVGMPMAGGLWRPVIFLPASARSWSAERRDVVLAHEIAHLAGRDPLRHVVARLAVGFYWFHPLAWIAARQATAAREEACDEAVLALGTRPSVYARVLLDLADSVHASSPRLGALPMIEHSLLERRLMAILTNDAPSAPGRRGLIPVLGVLLTLSVSAAQPSPSHPGTVAPQHPSTLAPSHPGTPAPLHPGTPVPLHPSTLIQAQPPRDSACWWDSRDGRSFSGSMSTRDAGGGRTEIYEQIGTRNSDRVIQKSFGDLRLCMLAEGLGDRDSAERPSDWIDRAARVVMEARRGSAVQRLEFERSAGGTQRISWQVGSARRAVDGEAQEWRDRMLAVLDTTWELSSLRGEVSSLRGQISSIRGQESSLRGEISSLRGEVSSMRGHASSIRGDESSLRGRISSIRGHVSSLHGAISSERGAISSLNASRYRADGSDLARIAARIRDHDAEIARIERAIREYDAEAKVAAVEREIAALDAAGKVAAIDQDIRAFDLDGKVAAVERRIATLDVDGKVAAIERQITALDADRRGRQMEERRDRELRQLEAAIAAIR